MFKSCKYSRFAKRRAKKMEKNFREKESKLDLMMELERLKELKFREEKEAKLKRYSSAKI